MQTSNVVSSYRSRCPNCRAFVSTQSAINKMNDVVFCRSCGTTINLESLVYALVAGTRRAETRLFEAQGVAFQNGPPVSSGGNALSNLLPNSKILKPSNRKTLQLTGQMDLFGVAL